MRARVEGGHLEAERQQHRKQEAVDVMSRGEADDAPGSGEALCEELDFLRKRRHLMHEETRRAVAARGPKADGAPATSQKLPAFGDPVVKCA